MTVELSVVIAAHNAAGTLADQIQALREQASADVEIIVVDNASTDGTAAIVGSLQDGSGVLRLEHEPLRGASAARNHGVSRARGRMLAFCDADDIVGPEWVAGVLGGLADSPVVTGPLDVHSLNEPAFADSRGLGWTRRLEDFRGLFPVAHSGNFAIRRDVFEALGGFDVTRPIGEDVDLSYRLWCAGHRIAFEPRLELRYRYPTTLGALWRQGFSHGEFAARFERQLRRDGHPVEAVQGGARLRRLAWMVRHLPYLVTPRHRPRWIWVLATEAGSVAALLRRG
ncbi:MAG: glycosyltransferase [Acidimicrobiia bacterium]|nr:glycosyltransferase [Acidimicrobiia bacterium]